jgi:tetratricopeptide (TPR) repeat protein
LIIWLALSNARIAEFATTLIVIALGVLIYLIPSFFHELGPSSTWSLAADRRQFFTVLLFLWNSSAGLVIVSLAVIVRSVTTGWKDRQFRLFDLCIVAFGGSILFALIFREDHFVGFRTFQPNIWWGLSACVLLLVPVVARRVTELLKNGVWYRWVTIAAIAIASIQIINGFSIAIAYPVLYLRHYSPLAIKTLDMARSKTGAYARFAIDPILENVDLRPYLSRPSIIRLSFSYQDDKKNYAAWSDFCNKVVDAPPVDIIDAAILHKGRSHANRYFEMSAWQATPLDEFFILWLNPKYLMNRDIENIEASLQQGRDDPELFHKLGLLYEKKGDIPMAQKNYKKILQLKPDYAPALIQSAVLSFNQNDYGEALTLLKHAVEIQPENAKLYYCIACVYSRQNQHDPAIEWLKKAVDKGYGNWDLLANDKDLDNIRHLPGYKELVKDKLH